MYRRTDLELAARWMAEHYGLTTVKQTFKKRVQYFFSLTSDAQCSFVIKKFKAAGLIEIEGDIVKIVLI